MENWKLLKIRMCITQNVVSHSQLVYCYESTYTRLLVIVRIGVYVLGESKVADLYDVVLCEENVSGGKVAVDDSLVSQVLHATCDLIRP